MTIRMVGIDAKMAQLRQRELFAFSAGAVQQALGELKQLYPQCGFVLLSTCNRTELWVSDAQARAAAPDYPQGDLEGAGTEEGCGLAAVPDLLELLCWLKRLAPASRSGLDGLAVRREGNEAIRHLFELCCGLRSQIVGEAQIINQIREALDVAHGAESTDAVIERLFQTAIASAKQVRSSTELGRADLSVATAAVAKAKAHCGALSQRKVLVIGNGVMGRKCAETFFAAGAAVDVTLRRFRHGQTIVPAGCGAVPYDDRYQLLNGYDIVISATVSPHHTLTRDALAESLGPEGAGRMAAGTDRPDLLLLDLAVPADIDPQAAGLEGLTLLDIDSMSADGITKDAQAMCEVELILAQGIAEFEDWLEFRSHLVCIEDIQQALSHYILERVQREIGTADYSASLSQGQAEALLDALRQSSMLAIGKMLFGLRDSLDNEALATCLKALRASALPAQVQIPQDRQRQVVKG